MRVETNNSPAWLISAMLTLAAPLCMAAQEAVSADQVVSALEATFGVHKGERRNHIKGACAIGEFVGSPQAQIYTRSALFSGKPLPVIARFSMPGGNPSVPDTARIARGMALEFRLPEGSLQHMTMLNTPVFGAASPKTFFDDLVAKTPDPITGKPDPEKIKAFKASHPDSLPQAQYLARNNPPTSWTRSSYFGIHTFKFVNRENKTTLVRWRFVPQDGEQQMTDDEIKSSPPNFLEQKLIERVERGPVGWDMMLTIGEPGDPEDNPTLLWPRERKEVKVGTLTMSAATAQKGAECEKINFDPLVMADGVAPTNDPVLLFRTPGYAISFGKRLGGN